MRCLKVIGAIAALLAPQIAAGQAVSTSSTSTVPATSPVEAAPPSSIEALPDAPPPSIEALPDAPPPSIEALPDEEGAEDEPVEPLPVLPAVPDPSAPERSDTLSIFGRMQADPRVAGSAHVIGPDELEEFSYADVHRILQQVPGVYVRDEDGYGLRPNIGLRGASSDRSAKIALMEDGVLFGPAPYSAPAAYYFPLMPRVSAVEVFKGPASIRYGPNTIGGAINLITRDPPSSPAAMIDAAVGQYRTLRLHGTAGAGGKHWGVLLDGARMSTTGFKELDGGGNTGFDKNEVALKAVLRTDPGKETFHELKVTLGYSDEVSNETYLGVTRDDFEDTPYRRYAASARDQMDWWRTQARLTYDFSSEFFDARVTAYRHDFSRAWFRLNRFDSPPRSLLQVLRGGNGSVRAAVLRGDEDAGPNENLRIVNNDRRFVSQGIQALSRTRVPELFGLIRQEIEVGLRFHHDRVERDQVEDEFAMRSGELVPTGADPFAVTDNFGRSFAFAAHVVDEVSISDLLLTPGLRLEVIDRSFEARPVPEAPEGGSGGGTSVVFMPGLGAYYQVAPWLGVLAGVHSGFSPVTPGLGNEDADPERSINYEAGVRFGLERTKAELIGFFSDYSNVLGRCTGSAGCPVDQVDAETNGGAVWVYGLESVAEQTFDVAQLFEIGLRLTYTLTLSEFRSSFVSGSALFGDVDEGDRLSYVPVHQGQAQISAQSDRWQLSASLSFATEMFDLPAASADEVDTTDRYAILDLAGSYAVVPDGEVYARLDNVLNQAYLASYRPFGIRPLRPLQFLVGYRHRFGAAE